MQDCKATFLSAHGGGYCRHAMFAYANAIYTGCKGRDQTQSPPSSESLPIHRSSLVQGVPVTRLRSSSTGA